MNLFLLGIFIFVSLLFWFVFLLFCFFLYDYLGTSLISKFVFPLFFCQKFFRITYVLFTLYSKMFTSESPPESEERDSVAEEEMTWATKESVKEASIQQSRQEYPAQVTGTSGTYIIKGFTDIHFSVLFLFITRGCWIIS